MKKLICLILSIITICCFAVGFAGCKDDGPEQTYTIIFKCENRDDVIKVVEEGDTLEEIPSLPEVYGYTYSWSVTDFSDVSKDMVVNAVKQAIKSVITLNIDGGSLDTTSVNVEYDAEYTIPAPSKTGYRFDKWTLEDNSVFASSGVCKIIDNITIKANYVKTHTITFKQDGQVVAVKTVDHGGSLEVVPVPNPVVGETVNWNRTDFSNITEDIVVEAITGAYRINYNLGTYKFASESTPRSIAAEGGTLGRAYEVVSPGGSVVLLQPTCYGYKFVKWQYNSVDFDGKNYAYETDIEVIAIWEVDEDSPRWDSGWA